jgi:hypothetical protein
VADDNNPDAPATKRDILELAQRFERAETTILRAIQGLGASHKRRLDTAEQRSGTLEQRLSDLEHRVLDLETQRGKQ